MTNMCCPRCGNRNIQVTTETNVSTTGKNYSGGKGCLGFLMFGPLGLLCGSCGEGQKTTSTSTTIWACPNCGHKFESPYDIRKNAMQKFDLPPLCFFLGIALAVGTWFLVNEAMDEQQRRESPIGTLMAIIVFILIAIVTPIILVVQAKKMLKQADLLEARMKKFGMVSKTAVNKSNCVNQGEYINYLSDVSNTNNSQNTYYGNYSAGVVNATQRQSQMRDDSFCNACGSAIVNGAAFCGKCGAQVAITDPAEQYQTQAYAPINNQAPVAYPVPQVQIGANEWKCPQCGAVNQNYVGTCGCGTRRP